MKNGLIELVDGRHEWWAKVRRGYCLHYSVIVL